MVSHGGSLHDPVGATCALELCRRDWCFSTFAISLQLLPASRICFSRCSSAGVHGVFVRLFLALGSCAATSSSVPDAAAALAGWGADAAIGLAIWSCGCARLTDLRFRALPGVGVGVGGCGAVAWESRDAVVADWRLGSSLDGANWAACCGLAVMGEGFRLRLGAGEAL